MSKLRSIAATPDGGGNGDGNENGQANGVTASPKKKTGDKRKRARKDLSQPQDDDAGNGVVEDVKSEVITLEADEAGADEEKSKRAKRAKPVKKETVKKETAKEAVEAAEMDAD